MFTLGHQAIGPEISNFFVNSKLIEFGMSENMGSDDDFGTVSFICKQFEVFAGGRWRIRGIGGQLARHLVRIWPSTIFEQTLHHSHFHSTLLIFQHYVHSILYSLSTIIRT